MCNSVKPRSVARRRQNRSERLYRRGWKRTTSPSSSRSSGCRSPAPSASGFGPYLKCGSDTRSIPKDEDVYEIELARALEILAQPKKGRGRTTRTVLKDFGKDSAGESVQLLDGRYGPYLTNGKLNASLPKGTDQDALDLDAATTILAERGKEPKRRRRAKKS